VVKTSAKIDWLSSYAFQDNPEFKPDPNFIIDDGIHDKYYKQVPEQYHHRLSQSTSEAELAGTIEQINTNGAGKA
jgi:hypothetical protein